MRIGVYGGSFDPVHMGHLLLAECCREQCQLDRVWFVLARMSPHKRDRQPAPHAERLEMLRLATGGHEAFAASTLEIDRGGISYTVDTLAEIRRQAPETALFLLMGADSLEDFPAWREPARICELATLVVVCRPDSPIPNFDALSAVLSPSQLEAIRTHHVEMPQIDISSSDLRRRIAAGRSIRYQTPRAIEKYIESHGLYRGG